MRDEEDSRSLLAAQVVDQLEHLRLRGHVEGRSRFVGDEELRLEGKGHGDHHPLALSAGELVRIGLGDQLGVRQVHLAEEVEHTALAFRRREKAMGAEGFRDLVRHPHHRVEGGHRLLEHRTDLAPAHVAPACLVEAQEIAACEPDRAGQDPDAAGQKADGRHRRHRLAGPRFPHDAERLARSDRKRHVLDGVLTVGEGRQPDGQVLDRQHGGGAAHHGSPA
jgi:hypothetical protein